MECSTRSAESVSLSNRRKVEEELVLGHELANQLGRVVCNGDHRSAESLVTKILCSFRNSLSILNGNDHGSEEELISHIRVNSTALAPPPPPPHIVNSSVCDAHKAVKSAAFMDRGGPFKRRKKITSQAWSKDGPYFNDDGHAWRKYGQKQIQNAIHPRSYFRSSQYDQRCKAIKHVQKLDDDSQLFRTTYYGNHTCTNSFLKTPQFVLDTTSSTTPTEVSGSEFMIIYDNSSNSRTNNQEQPLFLSTGNTLVESSHTIGNQSSLLSSSDYLVSPDTVVFMPSNPSLPSAGCLHRLSLIIKRI